MSSSWAYPYAQEHEPTWFASLDEAMPWAQTWGRPLVAIFVAEWCEWSARLLAETLTDAHVKDMLRSLVCTRVEGDGNLPAVEHWRIDIYPTALVLAPDGAELGRIRGFEEAATWAGQLQAILARGAASR